MYDDLEMVCHDLDQLTINMFDLMDQYIKHKMQMEVLLTSNYRELFRSRYIMGKHSVSQLQLPTEDREDITAIKTVISTVETRNKVDCTTFRLNNSNSENTYKMKENEEGIRERTVKDGDKKDFPAKIKTENGTVNDPIKWFGFVVPPNLRQVQKGFQRLLELAMECANVQSELEATRKKINKLRKLKRKFEKANAT